MKRVAMLAVTLLLVCGTSWGGVNVQNGSFEEPILPDGGSQAYNHGDIAPGGWQVGHSWLAPDSGIESAAIARPTYPGTVPTDGDQLMKLGVTTETVVGEVRQWISEPLVANKVYTLECDFVRYGAVADGNAWWQELVIVFPDLTSIPEGFWEPVQQDPEPAKIWLPGTGQWDYWGGPNHDITLWTPGEWVRGSKSWNTADYPNIVGKYATVWIWGNLVGIDNVVLTPEPATMMLLGLGGLFLRKRRSA